MCRNRSSTALTCPTWEFQCNTTQKCVQSHQICSGKNKCGDGSDDSEEACAFRNASGTTRPHPSRPPMICKKGQFRCASGDQYQCIWDSQFCNGVHNCRDSSDEMPPACQRTTTTTTTTTRGPLVCSSSKFRCRNNFRCVRLAYVCDGDNDCSDGSDEYASNCDLNVNYETITTTTTVATIVSYCNHNQFKCNDGRRCIMNEYVCDKDFDCVDGSGEDPERCSPPVNCSMGEFKCKNGEKCIPPEYICDGDGDCSDGSDEASDACTHLESPQSSDMTLRQVSAGSKTSNFNTLFHLAIWALAVSRQAV